MSSGDVTHAASAIVFLGDVAIPRSELVAQAVPYSKLSPALYAYAVTNLEGPLSTAPQARAPKDGLCSAPELVSLLQASKVQVVSLANNHAFDFGLPFHSTVRPLQQAGIACVGAGHNLEEATRPVSVVAGGVTTVFLSFGWRVIGCQLATPERAGVNPLTPEWVLQRTREVRQTLPAETRLVVLCHWNYELERYPQPMHRQIAHAAVHAGADLVVGSHAHCPHGIERVNNRWIVYDLGNWLLPAGEYLAGTLRYPALAQIQLAFRWDPHSMNAYCDWFRYEPSTHQLHWLESNPAETCPRARELTPFAGMSHADYARWFPLHRRKKKLLPVFRDCESSRLNRSKELWVAARQVLIGALRALKLKGAPS